MTPFLTLGATMIKTIDTLAIWTIRLALTFIFLMMAAYIGMDLLANYVAENYIVLEK